VEEWLAAWGHLVTALRLGLAPLLAIALAVAGLAALTFRRQLAVFAFLFALVGGGIGMLLGISRSPAVSAVLPGLVTLIGGALVTLLPRPEIAARLIPPPARGAERLETGHVAAVVGVCVGALMLSAVTGATFGTAVREASEAPSEAVASGTAWSDDLNPAAPAR
jgi:hypothetical protein